MWPKRLLRPAETAAIRLAYGLFAVLPLDLASAIGGFIARLIGPRRRESRTAEANLRRVYPEMPEREIAGMIKGVWDNLGRVGAEFPGLNRVRIYEDPRFSVTGAEHIDRLRDDGKPGLFFTAHIGNWELAPLAVVQRGLPLGVVYRAAKHPLLERLAQLGRSGMTDNLLPKGSAGARQMIGILNRGGHLGMLVDQKMNDGIAVPFFGRDAMTAPALAQLALKFDCPVVPVKVERTHRARFSISILPPLELPATGDRQADVKAGMALVNRIIEGWIRESPEQWLWVHRRWPD
ncbi:MAG: lipid A biosynthesis lauroyl acyltransferase [Proteobacteria bacterium]|nr:lipid A biosynthesis lauroyl acyltransferase [Pseudomonadota bacterium]